MAMIAAKLRDTSRPSSRSVPRPDAIAGVTMSRYALPKSMAVTAFRKALVVFDKSLGGLDDGPGGGAGWLWLDRSGLTSGMLPGSGDGLGYPLPVTAWPLHTNVA